MSSFRWLLFCFILPANAAIGADAAVADVAPKYVSVFVGYPRFDATLAPRDWREVNRSVAGEMNHEANSMPMPKADASQDHNAERKP